jgi:nicotinamide riboside kinase
MGSATPQPPRLCVAIVGAESTGKTTLAAQLAAHLAAHPQAHSPPGGWRVAWVPEVLREWCAANGRTPLVHEQAPLLRAQHDRITAACARHDVVVCDTTPLMTAVYSRIVFGDRSLDERAAELHARSVDITLLTALDLPWVADGLQRDGPHVQAPVDQTLRELMQRHGIRFSVVSGQGPERLEQALAALEPALLAAQTSTAAPARTRQERALFTGLGADARMPGKWACECCVPRYEQAPKR